MDRNKDMQQGSMHDDYPIKKESVAYFNDEQPAGEGGARRNFTVPIIQ